VATILKTELLKLDVAERLELIEELWESIVADPNTGDIRRVPSRDLAEVSRFMA
jgi:hypothetical protein